MATREEDIRELVLEWVAKAEQDFRLARVGLGEVASYPIPVAFLSQQCAEKYLKAFLTAHQIEFPKAHNIGELLDLVATKDQGLAGPLRDATALNPYAVDVRYPRQLSEMSPALAKEAVELASKVRDAVRDALHEYTGEPSA